MRPLERKLGHECGALLEWVECPHEKKHENLLGLSAFCHMKLEPEVWWIAPGRRILTRTPPRWHGFPTSRAIRNKCLLIGHIVYGIFL